MTASSCAKAECSILEVGLGQLTPPQSVLLPIRAADPTNTNGSAVVFRNGELLFPVLGILAATVKPEVVAVVLGKCPKCHQKLAGC